MRITNEEINSVKLNIQIFYVLTNFTNPKLFKIDKLTNFSILKK